MAKKRKRKRKTTRPHPSENLDYLACTDDDLRRRPDHVKFIWPSIMPTASRWGHHLGMRGMLHIIRPR